MNGPMLARESPRSESDMIESLLMPDCYPHPVQHVRALETHISTVFLTGELAYKVKKPVDLGFLDFSTLDSRRWFCQEELRLNRRTAPNLYLDVVAITCGPAGIRVGGTGTVIDYAVRMREFPQECLFDRMARAGQLDGHHADALASVIARFHSEVSRARPGTQFGAPGRVLAPVIQNFDQLEALASPQEDLSRLRELRNWSWKQYDALFAVFENRRQGGFVRECHGDLHLGNIAFISGQPVPFDCIEFNEELRWIDVMNEVGFVAMDFRDHGLPGLACRLVNRYLEITGDYAGVRVLRFYEVYRALVRAKIARLRERQAPEGSEAEQAKREYERRVDLASRMAADRARGLVVMHGLSGSGKTTVSQAIVDALGAVRLRSDVERKRLHGLDSLAHSSSAVGAGIYASASSERTYRRLASLARDVLESGRVVVIDAAFLKREQREMFRNLARETGAPFMIASCEAAPNVLRERVVQRERSGTDASEAGLAVLEHQFAIEEPLESDELDDALVYSQDDSPDGPRRFSDELARRLDSEKHGKGLLDQELVGLQRDSLKEAWSSRTHAAG